MARKTGQIIDRGRRTWLVRVYTGRDTETKKRKYLNKTIHGGLRDAQAHLNRMLSERDLGRNINSSRQTLNQHIDRWLEMCAKPRLPMLDERHSTLRQIDTRNVARLAPRWIFPMDDTTPLQTTPLVVDGIMYVTSANQAFALDAGSGRQIWHFQRPRSKGLVGNAAGGINRGAAVSATGCSWLPTTRTSWDAQQPLVLVEADWEGSARKLLLDANRNGFFYVLDRTNGKLLLAKPFVKKITWAREIGADGRPVMNPDQIPSEKGTRVCPSLIGAANWWSNAFDPGTGYYIVQTLESCGIFSKRVSEWEAGKGFNGGTSRESPDDRPQKILRAIDIRTGKIAWEAPEAGPGTTRGGVLATAGGWSSPARTPMPSWPPRQLPGKRYGTFRRTTSGGLRR